MRVAVFSDVHGNLTALEAVLADIEQQQVDEVVFAGDLCLFGPRPAACLNKVRQAGISGVYGNTDDWILGRQQPAERVRPLCQWNAEQLDSEEKAWLAALPFAHTISPTGNAKDDLLIVHANPQDVNQIIFPSEAEQMERYGRIRQSDKELGELVAGVEAAVLAFGHLHIPGSRTWNGLRLVNVSSTSIPGDGDPRAKYAVFTWEAGRWAVQHHRLPYPMAAEVEAYRQAQPPGWEVTVQTIEEHGFLSQTV